MKELIALSEAYLGPCQVSAMELFANRFNSLNRVHSKSLIISKKKFHHKYYLGPIYKIDIMKRKFLHYKFILFQIIHSNLNRKNFFQNTFQKLSENKKWLQIYGSLCLNRGMHATKLKCNSC